MSGFDDDLRGALHDDAWALPAPADPRGWVRARVRRRRARVLVAGAAAVGLLATGAVAVVGGGGGSAAPEQLNGPGQVVPSSPQPAECPVVPVPPGDPRLPPEGCWFAYAPLDEVPSSPSSSPSPSRSPRSCGDVRLTTSSMPIPPAAADCLLDGFSSGEAVTLSVTRTYLRGGAPEYPLAEPGEPVVTRYEVKYRRWVEIRDGRAPVGILGCLVLRSTGVDLVGDDCDA